MALSQLVGSKCTVTLNTLNQMPTLWSRETIRWPTKWVPVCAQDGVLLLHAKPGMLVSHHLHHLTTRVPKVGFCTKTTCVEDTRTPESGPAKH